MPRLTVSRLRWIMLTLLLALVIPTAVLVMQAQQQIKWEALYQHRALAEELSQRIDGRLQRWIAREESRSVTEYQFLLLGGQAGQYGYLQPSPLSQWPPDDAIPGLLGYFQVDGQGRLSTPLLPDDIASAPRWGLTAAMVTERTVLNRQLQDILGANRLVARQRDTARSGDSAPATGTPAYSTAESAADADFKNADADFKRADPANESANAAIESADADFESHDSTLASAVPAFESPDPATESADAAPTPRTEAATSKEESAFLQRNFDRLKAPAKPAASQQALGRIEELQLENRFAEAEKKSAARTNAAASKSAPAPAQRTARMEQSPVLAQPSAQASAGAAAPVAVAPPGPVLLFESAVDPFEFARLDSGHFVLFRKVWRDDKRLIQGALLDQNGFFSGVMNDSFQPTALAQMSNLIVAFQDNVLTLFSGAATDDYRIPSAVTSARAIRGTLLLQQRLSAPLSDLQLVFSVNHLPAGPGAQVITWTSLILLLLMLLVFFVLYRLGLKQIHLTRQQQDFVAAVSHELKTPLTSIRMFSEMLREGWVSGDKQKEYYAFISDESERLSRLIANVLQLARMERNDLQLDLKPLTVGSLLDLIRSRIGSQVERAGFSVQYDCPPACAGLQTRVDVDALVQILLNLVDNALKFSARAECKQIDIAVRQQDNQLLFSVRDYGPGIPPGYNSKIFELFYRIGSELTRQTQGTGIGLALVRQLARAMGGDITVVNRNPGAEFRLLLRQC